MKKNVMGLVLAAAVTLTPSAWAFTEDELFSMMMDARGAIYAGDFENSLDFCNQAIEANPDFAEAYSVRSEAKLNLNDVDGALADAKKAIEMKPDDSSIDQAYYVRAIIAFDHAADSNQALEFINKAIDLTKYEPLPEHFELRSEIYYKLNNKEAADADVAEAERLWAELNEPQS